MFTFQYQPDFYICISLVPLTEGNISASLLPDVEGFPQDDVHLLLRDVWGVLGQQTAPTPNAMRRFHTKLNQRGFQQVHGYENLLLSWEAAVVDAQIWHKLAVSWRRSYPRRSLTQNRKYEVHWKTKKLPRACDASTTHRKLKPKPAVYPQLLLLNHNQVLL